MTSDDNIMRIIRMAREAGCHAASHPMNPWSVTQEALERFAALVAAAEREACKDLWEAQRLTDQQISDHINAAVAAEREACAELVQGYMTAASIDLGVAICLRGRK